METCKIIEYPHFYLYEGMTPDDREVEPRDNKLVNTNLLSGKRPNLMVVDNVVGTEHNDVNRGLR